MAVQRMGVLKRGDTYTLNECEQRMADFIGRKREANATKHGRNNQQFTPKGRDPVEGNIKGMGAEIAFARLMNVFPDTDTEFKTGGPDCHLHSPNNSVDTKMTPYVRTPLLVVRISKQLGDSDLYACFTCAWPTYTFVGWAPEARVIRKESIKDIGHGRSYVLEPSELEAYLITADDIRWTP